jgi:hypothetical protein
MFVHCDNWPYDPKLISALDPTALRYKEFEMPHAPFVHPIFELMELDLTDVLVFTRTLG